MPRGNRTGPMGSGPRTGRGLGYCSGETVPGYMHGAPIGRGRGWGSGWGGGRGRGWGRQYRYALDEPPYYPEPMTADEESKYLEQTLENLKNQMNTIEKRMESLNIEEQK